MELIKLVGGFQLLFQNIHPVNKLFIIDLGAKDAAIRILKLKFNRNAQNIKAFL